MQQPALAEDGRDRCFGLEEGAEVRILIRAVGAVAGRSERSELRVPEGHAACGREELLVLRVRAGPATLDVREAGLVQAPRDLELVGKRQHEPLALGAVAQRRVVQDDRGGHADTSTRSVMRASRKRGDGLGAVRATQVAGSRAVLDARGHRGVERIGGVDLAKAQPKHQRGARHGRQRVGQALAGDARGAAVNRLVESEAALLGHATCRGSPKRAARASRRWRPPRPTGCRRTCSR